MAKDRGLDFPCPDCGPTTWALSLGGLVCIGCGYDGDEADPTEPCPYCYDGYDRPPPARRGDPTRVRLGPLRQPCVVCNGVGRKLKPNNLLTQLGLEGEGQEG